MGNRCYLVFNRPLVSRRTPSTWYLFFEYSHYPHVGPWIPLARAWVIFISWGHKVVWGFITILYLCHALLLYLRKCGMFSRYRQAQSHFRVPGRLQPLAQTSESVSEPANFVAGSLVGWPPEIYMNLAIALSWCLVGFLLVFLEVDRACVAICAPLQGKTFWKPCPRLWTTWSTVSRS